MVTGVVSIVLPRVFFKLFLVLVARQIYLSVLVVLCSGW